MRSFVFSLEEALDNATDARERCERALWAATTEVRRQEAKLARSRARADRARGRVHEAAPVAVGPWEDPHRASTHDRWQRRQGIRARRADDAARSREIEVRFVRHVVTLRRRELADAVERLQRLERLRAREGKQFRSRRLCREDQAREEIAAGRGAREVFPTAVGQRGGGRS